MRYRKLRVEGEHIKEDPVVLVESQTMRTRSVYGVWGQEGRMWLLQGLWPKRNTTRLPSLFLLFSLFQSSHSMYVVIEVSASLFVRPLSLPPPSPPWMCTEPRMTTFDWKDESIIVYTVYSTTPHKNPVNCTGIFIPPTCLFVYPFREIVKWLSKLRRGSFY